MTFRLPALGLLLSLNAAPLSAGQLEVQAVDHKLKDVDAATLDLVSQDIQNEPVTDGVWKITFKQPDAFFAKVRLTASAADREQFRANFNIPYFWDEKAPAPFQATLIKPDPQTNSVQQLRREARVYLNAANMMVLNQHARLIWRQLNAELSSWRTQVDPDDIDTAFYFLLTSKELANNRFFQPDDEVTNAMEWLSKQLGSPDAAVPSKIAQEATKIIGELRLARSTQYQVVVNRINEDIGGFSSGKRISACLRARAISDTMLGFDSTERAEIDPDGRRALQAMIGNARCIVQNYGKVTVDKAYTEYAKWLGEQMQERIALEEPNSNTTLVQQATSHLKSLQTALDGWEKSPPT